MNKIIKTTLETHLNANVAYDIKWKNVDFTDTSYDLYIEPEFVPIETERKFIGGVANIEDIVNFYVYVSIKKTVIGMGTLYDAVDVLRGLYSETRIDDVVVEIPNTITIREEGERLVGGIYVTVRYLGGL